MKDSVTHTWGFLGVVVSLCFVIFTITDHESKASASKTDHCNFGHFLSYTMSTWMKFAILGFFTAATFLWIVRSMIDTAAGEEGRAASEEDKAYNSALEKHSQAVTALKSAYTASKTDPVDDTVRDHYVKCVQRKCIAKWEMEDAKPVRGMERVHHRIWARIFYCLSLICLTAGSLSAHVSFYLSMESEVGCVERIGHKVMFIVPASVLVLTALYFFYIGASRN